MGNKEMKRCLIITAGPMGDYKPLHGLIHVSNDYIICVDGGTRHLSGLGVKPDIIIGDLDSSGELPDGVEVLKFKSEKDETDTMLAVMHGLNLGLTIPMQISAHYRIF
jgi:thiamine pyrophosphokinase